MPTIETLIAEAHRLGEDRIIFPIDILHLANELAEHPQCSKAIPALVKLLDHPLNFQRHVAVRALRLMGEQAMSRRLVTRVSELLLRDEAPDVRAESARFLAGASVHVSQATAALERASACDDTDYVRTNAREALLLLK